MNTATLNRSSTTAPAGEGAAPAVDRQPHLRPYLGYVGYFVGAGLISGGIVHYPLDHGFYATLAACGVALFLAATVLNEVVLGHTSLAPRAVGRIVGASLLLSIGIGLLSGGIQHFTDFPDRAATMIPVGLVLSFSAYTLRHGAPGQGRRLGVMAAGVVAVAAVSFLALGALADSLAADGSGGHGHAEVPADVGIEDHTGEADRGSEPRGATANEHKTQDGPRSDSGSAGSGDGHGSEHGH